MVSRTELAGDIQDCANRARDLGYQGLADSLLLLSQELRDLPSRPSVPIANIEARSLASRHFQNARNLLKGIL